ncbi:uncharacterized protein LOC126907962 isoform X2 [Daktulosphaira vitifoliae]|uniref:uncharacterized protein LOC126907962 isoform X2 n=1 Tax=Daktulosphaira vitifoliae TaxID=58002 RepID=UPI0021AA286F|nr:uncharacterized protein LOC126907962 isoform X2 [Daktulosphaira vitifoliae]
MHWQIYFELFFGIVYLLCKPIRVYSNAATGAMETLSRACEGMLTYDELSDEEKKIKERVREVLLMTNNETSFQALNIKKTYEIPENMEAIVKEIFPESTMIYSILDVWNKLIKINNKEAEILKVKLDRLNMDVFITCRNLIQILNNTYVQPPKIMVRLFNELLKGFHKKDMEKTGKISIDDFNNVIDTAFNNDVTKKEIKKSFENIHYVYYEAWLMKKRNDVNKLPSKLMMLFT